MYMWEGIISIVAIAVGAGLIRRWLELRYERRDGDTTDGASSETLTNLEARVKVLERIVTDRGYELRGEFDELER